MSTPISLKDRHSDATHGLILATAIELLEAGSISNVTARAVAKQAGMSERTVFRYFATRDDLLDAIAAEAAARMQSPPPPATIDDLLDYPKPLYRSFEDKAALVKGILHTELFNRVRVTAAAERWSAVTRLIDEALPDRSRKERRLLATNINYFLSATTWNYYRTRFELSTEDTIAAAKGAIRALLA